LIGVKRRLAKWIRHPFDDAGSHNSSAKFAIFFAPWLKALYGLWWSEGALLWLQEM
jgi:hypothetical protein